MSVQRGLAPMAGAAVAAAMLAGCASSGSTGSVQVSSPPAASSSSGATSTPTPSTAATRTTSKGFDSCTIVTRAEAAAAIDENVTPGMLGTALVEGGLACVFYGPDAPATKDPNLAQPDSVRVVLVKGANAHKWYADYRSRVPARTIHGLGDAAFFDGGASLSVLDDDSYLRIAVDPSGSVPSLADEEKLARAILATS